MNKIYEDMDWLPVEKAAEYLSHKTKSNISDIDVLRLCLFGKLKVSVYFSGSVPVTRGKLACY
jgi:23S rRNA-/tRNA-specific pseudouridylate synthase